MERVIASLFIILFSSLSISGEPLSSNVNTFNLNGKNVTLSDSMLSNLREHWKGSRNLIRTSSFMKKADVRWSLDYISLIEVINSKGCKSLEVVNTKKFDPEIYSDNTGVKIESGLFDYVWEVKVCDKYRNYRLVNPKDNQSFTLYPLNL
ncbi:hypothetical protein OA92_13050 [Marinomonas sp. SBI22]|uniref:hypothetical protein n=1 Tax=unclassified Marinomonas TaxID=196814 RepID=UPI0007AF716A|nr:MULTISPECIES: hypothetical protein [unclassified Marinomonas]KZM42129.1 hypothetical protein OA92_13050 [Marinomonas sp. SBI22]KZM47027.1 hypothetical protein OA91_00355 [Marinomonas sp. SBI8L]